MIKLIQINEKNFHTAIVLKTGDDHKHFVAPNSYSIAEGQFYKGINCYGIVIEESNTMVGFSMFGSNENEEQNDKRFMIWRFMIAEDQRRKGYAKAAMKEIIKIAKTMCFSEVVLSTGPANSKAINLYKSFGFIATGIIDDGEEEYVLKFKEK